MSDVLPPNGIGSSNDGGTPPPPPPPPPPAPVPAQGGSSSWYENIAIVVIALFCCSPLGLVLVWINKKWTTKTKTIVTAAVIAVGILGAIIGATSSGSSSSSSSDSKPTVTTVAKNSDSANSSEATTMTAKAAAACKDTPDGTNLDTKNLSLYPQRLGTAKDDHEAAIGDCVRIDGMTAFVLDARVLTPRYGDKVIVVKVKIRGRDGTKSYNPFDFKLQTASGNQESITFTLDDSIDELSSGSLVKGGEVTGDLVFEYQGPGTYYVVWEPSVFNDEKGIWALNVP